MKAVLDAGAFVAVDRGDRRTGAMLRVLQRHRTPLVTSAPVVAQVWRRAQQVRLAHVLAGVEVRPLGAGDDRRTGELLCRAKTTDVIDAHLALLVDDGDQLLTSDADDLGRLLDLRGVEATFVST